MKDFSCKEMKLFYSLTLDLLMGKKSIPQFRSRPRNPSDLLTPSRHTPTSYCIIQFSPTIIDLGNVCFTGFLMDVSFSSIATFILVLIENSSLFVIKAFKIQGNPFFTHMTGIHANFVVFCMTVFSHFHYSCYRERLMRCVTAHIYTGGDSS